MCRLSNTEQKDNQREISASTYRRTDRKVERRYNVYSIGHENLFFSCECLQGQPEKYTSFVTRRSQLDKKKCLLVSPLDLLVFQRFVNDVFLDLILDGVVLTYLDDLIVPFKFPKVIKKKFYTKLKNMD